MSAYRPNRLKFGIFMAPFHRVGENPTLAIERDIELIEELDRLGFDEAWIGEHHSAGWEIIASPELIIAAAAQRTKTIKLGTGVSSLPYHHPFILADRMVQLDHMTRGRAMFGVGPGALTSDAYMMGIDPVTQRAKMDESLGVILALMRGETVSVESDWFTLREARLQLAPYTYPHMPVACASIFSPAGPATAGKYGVGILSVATSQPGGLTSSATSWAIAEESAAKHGKTMNRDDWRLVMGMHLADTREEAFAQVREGRRAHQEDYFRDTLGAPQDPSIPDDPESVAKRGGAIIGTPDDAIAAVENMFELSGGFGCLLFQAHEWATTEQIRHSYELWARYVAPRFQGQFERIDAGQKYVADHRSTIFAQRAAVTVKSFADAGIALPEAIAGRMQRGGS